MQFFWGFKLCRTSRKVFAIVHKGDFFCMFQAVAGLESICAVESCSSNFHI